MQHRDRILRETRAGISAIKKQLRELRDELALLERYEARLLRDRGRAPRRTSPKRNGAEQPTRTRVVELFQKGELLTQQRIDTELGITTSAYHVAQLRDDRLIRPAGLVALPNGRGKTQQWRWTGPGARELRVVPGEGARTGRKRRKAVAAS